MRSFTRGSLTAALALMLALSLMPTIAGAIEGDRGCERQNNRTYATLLNCVTVDGVREHQQSLQDIADANGGTRASGTPGYDASKDYIVAEMTAAGYEVTVQAFDFPFYQELSDAILESGETTYVVDVDFATMTYSGNGDVTATATGVDLVLPPAAAANTSTSGCEAADFAGFPAGDIALIQRGTCSFALKALNAEAAGAVGVIIFNEGQPGRTDVINGTLSEPAVTIPVVGATHDLGPILLGQTVHLVTDTESEIRETSNIFAETTRGRDTNVVMVGAHLDSVIVGPGIQDNGSGSATLLEVAEAFRKVRPRNTVRFAWWGAEELGLVGSDYYVNNLTQDERDDIALYLNFDMVGSPNYVRFVYDGSGDTFGLAGPAGSAEIEELFTRFYGSRGLASDPTQISFRSDYAAFFDYGIPFGGLFTGAEGIKTEAQAAVYGGTAGEAYDPCYHQACDNFDNISLEVLDVNADAVAFSVLTYSYNTSGVNGEPGWEVQGGVPSNYGAPAPAGAQGAVTAEQLEEGPHTHAGLES